MTDRGQLRASDADRQLVEEVLNGAYCDGRLTKDEFDERLSRVWQARTFDDLAPLTVDLVATPAAAPVAPPAPLYETQHEVPTARVDLLHQSAEVDRIVSVMSSHKRLDEWRMHPRTRVTAVMGDAALDLSRAVLQSRDLHLEVTCVMGDVKVRIPAGVRVVDRVNCFMGDKKIAGTRPGNNPVTLTLTGTCVMGDVKIFGPDAQSWTEKLFGTF